jgi:hypothetical protein
MNKTIHILTVLAALLVGLDLVRAEPMGSHPGDLRYLAGTENLDFISVGVVGRMGERDVEVLNAIETTMDRTEYMGYVAIDLLRWVTVYGAYGVNEIEFDNQQTSDSESTWAVGLRLNLMDRDILAPFTMEDRIRLSVAVEWQDSETAYAASQLEWSELTASATIGILNEISGSKMVWPEAIELFAGPVYSSIQADELEEDDDIGYTVGLAFYINEAVTLTGEFQNLGSAEFLGGVNLQF